MGVKIQVMHLRPIVQGEIDHSRTRHRVNHEADTSHLSTRRLKIKGRLPQLDLEESHEVMNGSQPRASVLR